MQLDRSIRRPCYTRLVKFPGDRGTLRLTGFKEVRVPPDVYPLDYLRTAGRDEAPARAGVYFLWRGPQLLYVGQSVNLSDRLWSHDRVQIGMKAGKIIPYTRQTFIECDESARMAMESRYIHAYMPPYNEQIRG